MKRLIPLIVTMALCLGLLLIISSCDSASDLADGQTHVRVRITDAPADSMLMAEVTIQRIELRDTSGTLILLSDEESTFDLLELQNGFTTVVADTLIPEGQYEQIRIIVAEEARVKWNSGAESDLKVPGGSTSGIKIIHLEHALKDDEGLLTEILLDFDVAESFVVAGSSGKVIFKPVIRLMVVSTEPDLNDSDEIDNMDATDEPGEGP